MAEEEFGSYSLLWLLNAFLLIVVIAGIVFLVNYSLVSKTDTTNLRMSVFVARAAYSENGLCYKNNLTGRVYPLVLDLKRFNKETLENSIAYDENRMVAANFTLFKADGTKISSFLYNSNIYNIWEPLIFTPNYASRKFDLSVLAGEERIPAKLSIEVVVPRG